MGGEVSKAAVARISAAWAPRLGGRRMDPELGRDGQEARRRAHREPGRRPLPGGQLEPPGGGRRADGDRLVEPPEDRHRRGPVPHPALAGGQGLGLGHRDGEVGRTEDVGIDLLRLLAPRETRDLAPRDPRDREIGGRDGPPPEPGRQCASEPHQVRDRGDDVEEQLPRRETVEGPPHLLAAVEVGHVEGEELVVHEDRLMDELEADGGLGVEGGTPEPLRDLEHLGVVLAVGPDGPEQHGEVAHDPGCPVQDQVSHPPLPPAAATAPGRTPGSPRPGPPPGGAPSRGLPRGR